MPRKLLALFAIVIPLVFAACGDDDSDTTSAASDTSSTETSTTVESSGGGRRSTISETEYKLDPSDPTTGAGTVTFNLSNDGEQVHNLEVEGNGIEEVSDDIDPGGSAKFAVDLEAGTYEIYCAIDGHKDLGMEGELTVQ